MVLVCINAYFMSTYCCIICDQVLKYFFQLLVKMLGAPTGLGNKCSKKQTNKQTHRPLS